jgi:hypothetical protein
MSSIVTVFSDASDTLAPSAFTPNATTVAAMLDARAGRTTRANFIEELFAQLNAPNDEPTEQGVACAR